jgi:hypothetical protein
MKRLVRPTLLLIPAQNPGFSKLGGAPELPDGVEWPPGDVGPRSFLGQIDLGIFGPHSGRDWLPETGWLYAFYDPERHGFADVVRILYSTEEPGPQRVAPPGLKTLHPERRVAFMTFTSAPSLEWLNIFEPLDLDPEDLEKQTSAFADAPPSDDVQHRIGGYPNEIQSECMPVSCERLARGLDPLGPGEEEGSEAILRASKQWRLLMQIDSDPDLKMNFGDGGRLYVFVRERDARRSDFSKTVANWQTH